MKESLKIRNSLPRNPKLNKIIVIFGENSPKTIAAILGVLNAGFAYSVLTPWAEPTSLKQILEAIKPDILITTELEDWQQKNILEATRSIKLKYILDIGKKLNQNYFLNNEFLELKQNKNNSKNNSKNKIKETDIAYALGTSGSTGQSKIVLISHLAAKTAINMFLHDISIKKDMTIGNYTPFCFDISIFDIFATLSVGATIEIIPLLQFSKKKLIDHLNSSKINSIFLGPGALTYELKLTDYTKLIKKNNSLKQILLSGEPIPEKLLEKLFLIYPSIEIWNLYGGTEFPYALSKKINPNKIEESNTFDLSENKCNALVKLKNNFINKNSELLIGGDVIFTKYLFSPNDNTKYEKINGYHPSGDLARIEDNKLTLHGRIDWELKIQDVRINLYDVEQNIKKDPKVLDVLAIPDINKEHLHIYIVLEDGNKLNNDFDIKPICEYTYHIVEKLPKTKRNTPLKLLDVRRYIEFLK